METRNMKVTNAEFQKVLLEFMQAVQHEKNETAIKILKENIFLEDMINNKTVIIEMEDKSPKEFSAEQAQQLFRAFLQDKVEQLPALLNQITRVQSNTLTYSKMNEEDLVKRGLEFAKKIDEEFKNREKENKMRLQNLPKLPEDQAYKILADKLVSIEKLRKDNTISFSIDEDTAAAFRSIKYTRTRGCRLTDRKGKLRLEISNNGDQYEKFRLKVIARSYSTPTKKYAGVHASSDLNIPDLSQEMTQGQMESINKRKPSTEETTTENKAEDVKKRIKSNHDKEQAINYESLEKAVSNEKTESISIAPFATHFHPINDEALDSNSFDQQMNQWISDLDSLDDKSVNKPGF